MSDFEEGLNMNLPNRYWEIQPTEEDKVRLEKEMYEKYINSSNKTNNEIEEHLPFE